MNDMKAFSLNLVNYLHCYKQMNNARSKEEFDSWNNLADKYWKNYEEEQERVLNF